MASPKAREAWINAYNEWVSSTSGEENATRAAHAEIDAAVAELVEAAEFALENIDGCIHEKDLPSFVIRDKLRAALNGWRIKT